jgi:hypothetical protein
MVPLALIAAAPALATPALPATEMAETCHGSETIRIGDQPPRSAAYDLAFSADLDHAAYCYGACGKDETGTIADPASSPLKLVDIDRPGQARHLTFDAATARLSDYQRFDAGLAVVIREANATCRPAPYRQPWIATR